MSKKSARGVKRKCQNEECATPFYDLNRDVFACPVCGTEFDHEASALAMEQLYGGQDYARRKQPRVLPISATTGTEGVDSDASNF